MIRLTRVELKNFLSHADSALDLDRRGLVLIRGINADAGGSNGAGKTCMFNALPWCLFGQTPQGLKADEVIREGQTSACVKVFGYKDNQFCVERTRGPAGLRWWIAGNEMSGPSIKETQLDIEAYLGLDYKSFIASVMFPQGFAGFASMSQAEQKEVLNSLLDLGRFEEAFERLKAYKTSITQNLLKLEEDHRLVHHSISSEEQLIETLQATAKSFEAQKLSRIEALQQKINQLGLPPTLSENDRVTLEDLEEEDPSHQNQRILAEQAILERKHSNKLVQLAGQSQHYQTLLGALREPVEHAEDRCETCGQSLPAEEQAEAHKRFKAALAKYNADLLEYSDKLKKVREEELALKVGRVNQDSAVTDRQREIEHKVRLLNNLRRTAGLVRDHQSKLDLLEESISVEQARVWTGHKAVEQAKAKVKELKDNLPKLETEIREAKEELTYAEFWHEGFGSTGLKHFALATITPYLSDRANFYLQQLTSGVGKLSITTQKETKKGGLSDSLHIEAELGGGKVYEARSGGEQRRISIALLFALAEVMSTRARVKINLLVLDEPMESVDAEGASAIISLLQSELSKHKDSIFLVSHNESLQSEVETVIVVEKRDGVSRVL